MRASIALVRTLALFSCVLVQLVASSAQAEVEAKDSSGFVSTHQLRLAAPPKQVYQALTRDIHRWWDATHSYSGQAKNFRLQAQAGGCFCERLDRGGSVEHMRIVFAQPGKLLRLSGGLGPLQGMGVAGAMDFALTPIGDDTVLNYRYSVSGANFSGLEALAEPVDQVQLGQLRRLQRYLQQRPKSLN